MNQFQRVFYTPEVTQWGTAIGAFLVALIVFALLGRVLRKRFIAWTAATSASWDDVLLARLETPMKALILVAALAVGLQLLPIYLRSHPVLNFGSKIVVVLMGLWILDRIAGVILKHADFPTKLSNGTRTLLLTIVRLFAFGMTFLIILDTLGISITPILASLGIGSVAVALALQDTLGNLFSGFYILLDRPICVGNYIRLQDGSVEGTVKKIGWRSTQIEIATSNLVVIPNSKLSNSVVTNFDFPSKETSTSISLGIGYNTDLEKAEKTLVQIAKEVGARVPGVVTTFEPLVRFQAFGDSAIQLLVIMRVQQFTDQFFLKHELIKAVHKGLQKENVEIPFPQQVVHLQKAELA